jgi:hypothetical protein
MVVPQQQPPPRRARRDDLIALPTTWVIARIAARPRELRHARRPHTVEEKARPTRLLVIAKRASDGRWARRSRVVRCARGSRGCRHARIARGSGSWPSARSTSRALKRSRARRRRNESRLPPVGRCFRRAERAGAARRTWAASDPTRDRGSCCVWSAGRGEDVVAGLLAAAAGSGADATVVVVLGVPVTLLARQAAAQAWIVARRTPTSPAVWRVTMRPAAARRHQRNRG